MIGRELSSCRSRCVIEIRLRKIAEKRLKMVVEIGIIHIS
jgi:hypothetical protein